VLVEGVSTDGEGGRRLPSTRWVSDEVGVGVGAVDVDVDRVRIVVTDRAERLAMVVKLVLNWCPMVMDMLIRQLSPVLNSRVVVSCYWAIEESLLKLGVYYRVLWPCKQGREVSSRSRRPERS
jgi:hypothetical protein